MPDNASELGKSRKGGRRLPPGLPSLETCKLRVMIGFLGFGEAGYHLARGLRSAGAPPLVAFDVKAPGGSGDERIRARAEETGTHLVETPRGLAERARVILSVVTAASAHDAAAEIAASLTASHLFVDCNSVSPATK